MMQPRSTYRRIVVGVDGSDEAMNAAGGAARLAGATDAELLLVHATRDYLTRAGRVLTAAAAAISSTPSPTGDEAMIETARGRIAASLADHLPEEVTPSIHVERGRAGVVIERFAHDQQADLIVVGGKHHSAVGRWLGGSTAHFLAGCATAPVLVTKNLEIEPQRILVAADLSENGAAVFDAAERMAHSLPGALKILHVVEPAEREHESKRETDPVRVERARSEIRDQIVRSAVHDGAEHRVTVGDPWKEIQSEVSHWDADILVVGSHGGGFQHPHLLGRLTESCLHDLPASVLVVPTRPNGP